MRRLTLREVEERHGGTLPPDAVFRPDDDDPARPPTCPTPKRRTARSDRFSVLNAFVDFGVAGAGLTPGQALVWLVLFRDTKATGLARTGQADIARRARLSVRGVKLAQRRLRATGLVEVVRRGRLNAGPSVYRVHPVARTG